MQGKKLAIKEVLLPICHNYIEKKPLTLLVGWQEGHLACKN